MKRIIYSIILATVSFAHIATAEELPNDAMKVIKEMERKIQNAERETEKTIMRKKRDVVKTLERVEKRIDNEYAKNLIKIQLIKYREEIQVAEGKINNNNKDKVDNEINSGDFEAQAKEAEKIIDFNQSYFFPHPSGKPNETGEFKFYSNGKVNYYHREGSTVKMFKKWDWSMKDGKLVIAADKFHGPVFVSKKSPKEIYLDWKGMLNKKNVAKQK